MQAGHGQRVRKSHGRHMPKAGVTKRDRLRLLCWLASRELRACAADASGSPSGQRCQAGPGVAGGGTKWPQPDPAVMCHPTSIPSAASCRRFCTWLMAVHSIGSHTRARHPQPSFGQPLELAGRCWWLQRCCQPPMQQAVAVRGAITGRHLKNTSTPQHHSWSPAGMPRPLSQQN